MFAVVLVSLVFWSVLGYAVFDILREAEILPRTQGGLEPRTNFQGDFQKDDIV